MILMKSHFFYHFFSPSRCIPGCVGPWAERGGHQEAAWAWNRMAAVMMMIVILCGFAKIAIEKGH